MSEEALQFIGYLQSSNEHSSELSSLFSMEEEKIRAILNYLHNVVEDIHVN